MAYIPHNPSFRRINITEFLHGKEVITSDEYIMLTVSGCDVAWTIDIGPAEVIVLEWQRDGIALWVGLVSFFYERKGLGAFREGEIIYLEHLGFQHGERTGNITRLEMVVNDLYFHFCRALGSRPARAITLEGANHE